MMFDMNYSGVNVTTCVCRDCKPPKRCSGCHSTCKEYIAWREEYDRQKNVNDDKKWLRSLASRGD